MLKFTMGECLAMDETLLYELNRAGHEESGAHATQLA